MDHGAAEFIDLLHTANNPEDATKFYSIIAETFDKIQDARRLRRLVLKNVLR